MSLETMVIVNHHPAILIHKVILRQNQFRRSESLPQKQESSVDQLHTPQLTTLLGDNIILWHGQV